MGKNISKPTDITVSTCSLKEVIDQYKGERGQEDGEGWREDQHPGHNRLRAWDAPTGIRWAGICYKNTCGLYMYLFCFSLRSGFFSCSQWNIRKCSIETVMFIFFLNESNRWNWNLKSNDTICEAVWFFKCKTFPKVKMQNDKSGENKYLQDFKPQKSLCWKEFVISSCI